VEFEPQLGSGKDQASEEASSSLRGTRAASDLPRGTLTLRLVQSAVAGAAFDDLQFGNQEKSVNTEDRVAINKLPTEFQASTKLWRRSTRIFVHIIAGAPGSGKTTLAHQFGCQLQTPERPALYFTSWANPL